MGREFKWPGSRLLQRKAITWIYRTSCCLSPTLFHYAICTTKYPFEQCRTMDKCSIYILVISDRIESMLTEAQSIQIGDRQHCLFGNVCTYKGHSRTGHDLWSYRYSKDYYTINLIQPNTAFPCHFSWFSVDMTRKPDFKKNCQQSKPRISLFSPLPRSKSKMIELNSS